ncbi:hypothetical protein [Chryseobacterium chendengshani]|nr:hypothetical protein [Chryseobacterium sp. LJ756]MBW7674806.1 hypothetical protein [Chryseobacterium sp. LJ756]
MQRNTLYAVIDAQAQSISDCNVAAESCVEAFNTLYKLLIKYAGIG